LFTQIATQVGFALDHARLLGQVDRDYQSAQGLARQEQQQNQALNHQVSTFFEKNQTVVEILSNRALNQMESVTLAYQQMQEVADLSKQMMTTAQQAEEQLQQANHRGQTEQALMKQVGEKMVAIQETIIASGETIQQLRQPCEKLSQIMTGIEPIISQLKLQSMKAQLGAGRTGESGREIATLAQKIHALVQELGKEFGEISPVLAEVQGKTQKVTTAIETELDLAITGCQLNQDAQQAFEHMARANSQLTNLVNEIVEAAATQRKNTTSASQSVLEMADLTSQTSEQFLSMSNSFNQLVQTEE
ncbi:MAG: methyl-accepting chemotaxis protein, partial [Cyanobacteria bacterium P01_G01_bin.49]